MTVKGWSPRLGAELPAEIQSEAGGRLELPGFAGLNQHPKFKVDWWAKDNDGGHSWSTRLIFPKRN